MDVFKINKDGWDAVIIDEESTPPDLGEVKGIDQISWVERFNFPGEFTIIGNPSLLQETLPLGTYISHDMTDTIMVVENHVVDESEGETAKLTATGRTIDASFMDNRVVLYNPDMVGEGIDIWEEDGYPDFSIYPMQYQTGPLFTWGIVYNLLKDHLQTTVSGVEDIPNLYITTFGLDPYGETEFTRCTKRLSYLSDVVYEMLQSSDVGLKVCRPGPERLEIETDFIDNGGSFDPNDPENCLMFVVYRGEDISNTVTFDFNNGDLHKARYFWSIRDMKTGFYSGNQTHTFRYLGDATGSDLKAALVDANDYIPEVGATSSEIISVLNARGRDVTIPNGLPKKLIDVVISKNAEAKYQIDYKLGDIVNVFGNYGINQTMRVVEVATVQDVGIAATIPTLAPIFNDSPFSGG